MKKQTSKGGGRAVALASGKFLNLFKSSIEINPEIESKRYQLADEVAYKWQDYRFDRDTVLAYQKCLNSIRLLKGSGRNNAEETILSAISYAPIKLFRCPPEGIKLPNLTQIEKDNNKNEKEKLFSNTGES